MRLLKSIFRNLGFILQISYIILEAKLIGPEDATNTHKNYWWELNSVW